MFNFETKFRSSNTSREQLIRQVNRLTKIHPRFLSLFTLGIVNGADSYLSTSRDPPPPLLLLLPPLRRSKLV